MLVNIALNHSSVVQSCQKYYSLYSMLINLYKAALLKHNLILQVISIIQVNYISVAYDLTKPTVILLIRAIRHNKTKQKFFIFIKIYSIMFTLAKNKLKPIAKNLVSNQILK